MNNYYKVSLIILGILIFNFLIPEAGATQLFFDAETKEVSLGQQFEVEVKINTQADVINALEGKIIFSDSLKLASINDGNSIINLWVQKPVLQDKSVVFAGIIPGGYTSVSDANPQNPWPNRILSLVFEAEKLGDTWVKATEGKALLNDGLGTEAKFLMAYSRFVIRGLKQGEQETIAAAKKDIEPPESFVPEIASDQKLFNGQQFLVFATQDKDAGIDYYAISESRRKTANEKSAAWVTADSPYLLQDQKLGSYIYVKAVDKAGNEKITMLAPQKPLSWYEKYFRYVIIYVIIIVGISISLLYVIWKILRRKKSR